MFTFHTKKIWNQLLLRCWIIPTGTTRHLGATEALVDFTQR